MIRKPTDTEYSEFTGLHCFAIWGRLSDRWRCPSCLRTKREVMKWGERRKGNVQRFGRLGWLVSLNEHHDHGVYLTGRERFPRKIVCGGCNVLDSRVKKGIGLIGRDFEEFSFSPLDMRLMFRTDPQVNGPIKLDCIDFRVAIDRFRKGHRQMIAFRNGVFG
jgi:hypothetical protein